MAHLAPRRHRDRDRPTAAGLTSRDAGASGGRRRSASSPPLPTFAGGIGKLAKLADGHLDLHSGRSQLSTESLAARVRGAGASPDLVEGVRHANTALDALPQCQAAGLPLGDVVAAGAQQTARAVLLDAPVEVEVVVIDRGGTIVGRSQRRHVVEFRWLSGNCPAVSTASTITTAVRLTPASSTCAAMPASVPWGPSRARAQRSAARPVRAAVSAPGRRCPLTGGLSGRRAAVV
jgi:hypothetical protein